ncbi:MAG TPA: hypothetical protein DEP23_06210 [Ruminococcaceae bacterium]|nr:hypothetical protein [Oscillospiraceae bacterium]
MTYIGKPIGARKLTWFPLVSGPGTGAATYGAPVKLSRLITITATPILMEGMLESDDGIEDDLSYVVGYDVSINASQLTDSIRSVLLGHTLDDSGGSLVADTDVAQEGALAWEELISSNASATPKYKKVVLYRGKFKEFAETANTKVQGGVTFQTHNITGRFLRRNDGSIKYTLREDTPGASAAKLAAWFDIPQESGTTFEETVAKPVADPVAGAVAAGTNVGLTSETEGASIRYTLDGGAPNAGSTIYDGPITINSATTIKAIAFKSGMNASDIFEAAYTLS